MKSNRRASMIKTTARLYEGGIVHVTSDGSQELTSERANRVRRKPRVNSHIPIR